MDLDAPDHEELAQALSEARAEIGAAELHGAVCGFLCPGGEDFQSFLSAMSLEHLVDEERPESTRRSISAMFLSTRQQIDDDAFGFPLLLPASNTHIAERGEALVQWCQGFISGLGLGGMLDQGKLSSDGREILADMAEIARSSIGFDESEEVDEQALEELSEFARTGVLLLREDFRRKGTLQ